ncbi:MAG: hypothetical protein Ct9H300mP22_4780 [Gammaproteobacteria bacterium]|nr:MAG: hypothetical protein Ct9H300mP22_4780 [Gammaproteobacteria bacterium]
MCFINKLLITITLVCFSIAANSADTFDEATGQLIIPKVVAADGTLITTSFLGIDLRVTVKEVLAVGNNYPLSSRSLNPKPDFYDLSLVGFNSAGHSRRHNI